MFPPWGRRTAQDSEWISSEKAENFHLVSNGAVRVFQLYVTNVNGANTMFLQIFDSPKIPQAGDDPLDVLPLPIAGAAGWAFGERGRVFKNGFVWAVSTTGATLTFPAVDDAAWGGAAVLRMK